MNARKMSEEEKRKRHYRGPRDTSKKKKQKKSNVLSNIILVIAVIVFLFSAYKLFTYFSAYYAGGHEYDQVKELVADNSKKGEEPTAEEFTVDFDGLKAINPDTVAWIRFDEPAVISYPVVQGKDNSEYLTRTFQANDNLLGAIFMNVENKSDFSDRDTLIYGHNLQWGGEMFSQLTEYESQDFCKQHPYFYIYTPDGKVSTYQVFAAAVVSEISDQYIMTYNSDEEFQAHIDLIKSEAAYGVDVEVNTASKIVSLSTCTNVNESERFLLHGVKVDEKEFAKK